MYISKLTMKDTQKAIKIVKDNFENKLAETLNLDRVSAPILVESNKGINDDLGIKNSALNFYIDTLDYNVEIVQSLAKWKRIALNRYGYLLGEGIYTDMNAIRPKDIVDQTHSLYVDQWDWELVISRNDRTTDFLKTIVRKIMKVLVDTKELVRLKYPDLKEVIKEDIYFIDSEDLDNMYPGLTMREKERLITKDKRSVFIMNIGKIFKDGNKHDLRAPDYDDWNLNGDILIWSDVLDEAVELSSMGIRVDKDTLLSQLKTANREDNLNNMYHQMIIEEKLPLTIGGGIGQSRICMILLEKYHIAEVQASIWNEEQLKLFKDKNINYL